MPEYKYRVKIHATIFPQSEPTGYIGFSYSGLYIPTVLRLDLLIAFQL